MLRTSCVGEVDDLTKLAKKKIDLAKALLKASEKGDKPKAKAKAKAAAGTNSGSEQ